MDVHQQTKTKQRQDRALPLLCFVTDVIKPSSNARNIGVIFDITMSMLPHINNVCKSAFYHRCTISRIRKYLLTQTTDILIHTFVTSKLDHWNSLLYNVPKNVIKKLQSIQNAAGRLPSSSIFIGYLFLNKLISRFYYLPSRLCISNLQPTFKTLSPGTYCLDRFSHLLCSVWILLALTLRPMDLEHSLSQPPNFRTNYLMTYAHARI